MFVTDLSPVPETACGASWTSAAEALIRCRGEAVERVTGWRADSIAAPSAADRSQLAARELRSADFWHAGRAPVHSARKAEQHLQVTEVFDDGSMGDTYSVDPAAVLLSTDGWFPAGSCGLAAGRSPEEAWNAAVTELRERDLVTRWWSDELPGVELPAHEFQQLRTVMPSDIGLHALAVTDEPQAPPVIIVAATDPVDELIAIGAAIRGSIEDAALKAGAEACISLAQLRRLLAHPELVGMELPAHRRVLDLPRERFVGFEHTLLALADPRFASRVAEKFSASAGFRPVRFAPGDSDPTALMRKAGRRVFRADLSSPEARWAGAHVCRAISPRAHVPVPWCAASSEFPVPLA